MASVPVDKNISPHGAALYALLQRVSASDSFIFGHHNDDIEGQQFDGHFHFNGPGDDAPLLSDVATATHGTFPGMTGFNLDWIAREVKLSTAGWSHFVKPLLAKGVIFSFFWESTNPVTGGTAKDLGGSPITEILPGGSANALWRQWMDRIAAWFDAMGIYQALFRPFHENTGGWFWWGATSCTPDQFRAAWKYTTGYLREKGM